VAYIVLKIKKQQEGKNIEDEEKTKEKNDRKVKI